MDGGWTVQDVNSEEVQNVAISAVQLLNGRSNSRTPLTLVNVISAKTQVVNRIKYELDLEISQGENSHKQRVVVVENPVTNGLNLLKHEIVE